MLSSLIAFLKALGHKLSKRLHSRTEDAAAAAAPAAPRPACIDPLCGVVKTSCPRDFEKQGLQTHSVWIRVDTQQLIDRLLQNPDIDLDALQGLPRRPYQPPPQPLPESAQTQPERAISETQETPPNDWHEKVRRITQAPPAKSRSGSLSRTPPPRSRH